MKIGDKIKFTFKNQFGTSKQEILILSDKPYDIVDEEEISNEEIVERLEKRLQQFPLEKLVENGYILAARNLLKKHDDAVDIKIALAPQPSGNGGGGDAGAAILILAIIAIIVAIIVFPLLVILGMHNKLFLKNFYNKYEGEEFKKFVKNYTYIGIGLYALVAILVAIDSIFNLYMLTSPAFGILFFGGVAYFVASLLIIKKKFAGSDEKIDVIGTLKSGFKKEKK